MIAILGSGFGLYGYLPALVGGCGQRVVLPERYRDRFSARSELARFASAIEWEMSEIAALDHADGVVLALRPTDQVEWITQCLKRENLQRLLLEKPLASNPEFARTLNHTLARSGKLIRMGYTFRFTSWAKQLRKGLSQSKSGDKLIINWSFLSHHLSHDLHNWKRTTETGGGAIRFYGIQLIALLAEIGYDVISSSRSFGMSQNEVDRWTASFAGPGLPSCNADVDSRAALPRFRVELANQAITVIADQSDPFAHANSPPSQGGLDRRILALTSLCHSLWKPTTNEPACYAATIELWRQIEEKTIFERRELSKV